MLYGLVKLLVKTYKKINELLLNKDSNKKPLILKINKLYISNVRRGNNYFTVTEMNISFYTKENNQCFEYLTSGNYIIRNGKKNKNITYLTKYTIDDFTKKYNEHKITPLDTPADSIYINTLDRTEYNIYKITKFNKGIYWTFDDFKNNIIDSITKFKCVVTYNNDQTSLIAYLRLKNSDKKKQAMWGFSDGDNLFYRIGNKFYRIEKRDRNFILTYYPPSYGSATQSNVLLFGLAGGLITYAIEAGTTKNIEYYLDFTSQRFKLNRDLSNRKVEANNIFYLSSFAKAKKPVDLIFNNKTICSLSPSNYYVLKTSSDIKQFEIKIKNDTSEITTTIYPLFFNSDVYTIIIKKDGTITLDKFYGEMKKSVIDKINNKLITNPCTTE